MFLLQLYQDTLAITCLATRTTCINQWGSVQLTDLQQENIVYTLYLDYLADRDPASIKFFDKTGFQLPDAGHGNYGYSPVGDLP